MDHSVLTTGIQLILRLLLLMTMPLMMMMVLRQQSLLRLSPHEKDLAEVLRSYGSCLAPDASSR